MARTSNYALRLLASLKAEAEKVAAEEGTTLNQFINVAVAEKLAVLRTARYFQERAWPAPGRNPRGLVMKFSRMTGATTPPCRRCLILTTCVRQQTMGTRA